MRGEIDLLIFDLKLRSEELRQTGGVEQRLVADELERWIDQAGRGHWAEAALDGSERAVRLPMTIVEAELMFQLGRAFLEEHAPERLGQASALVPAPAAPLEEEAPQLVEQRHEVVTVGEDLLLPTPDVIEVFAEAWAALEGRSEEFEAGREEEAQAGPAASYDGFVEGARELLLQAAALGAVVTMADETLERRDQPG